MIRLVQEYGAHSGKEYTLERDRVRVGRAPDNDVAFDPLADLDASGKHCELLYEQGSWWVVDLKSRNGTFLNGERVERSRLVRGDVVECGRGGPRLRVEQASTGTAPAVLASVPAVGSGPLPPMPPRPHPASPTPLQNPAPAPPLQAAPAMPAPPPPAPSPAMPSPASFGAQRVDRGATLAVHMESAPGGPASPGQAAASALPQGAHVGRRTVALMIDEALQRARREQPSGNRGLKALVAVFALLAAAGTGTAAWLLLDEDRAPRRSEPAVGPSGDASNLGARIAAANEANVYILAIERGTTLRGFCTGFAVTPTLIATNAHCVHNATDEISRGGRLVALRNKSPGARLAARPAYADARFRDRRFSSGGNGYDVGLVRVDSRMPGQVRLATDAQLSALHEGDAIFVYGFPGMTMNVASPVATITLGLLNRVTDFFDGVATSATAQKLQHSAQTSGGSSGSAIFTPDGAVIGLNAGSLADDERQVVVDPNNGQRREVEVNRGSNFKYGMRADLIRQGIASLGERVP